MVWLLIVRHEDIRMMSEILVHECCATTRRADDVEVRVSLAGDRERLGFMVDRVCVIHRGFEYTEVECSEVEWSVPGGAASPRSPCCLGDHRAPLEQGSPIWPADVSVQSEQRDGVWRASGGQGEDLAVSRRVHRGVQMGAALETGNGRPATRPTAAPRSKLAMTSPKVSP